jgi:transcriptional regulator with XRE-family HTH domain
VAGRKKKTDSKPKAAIDSGKSFGPNLRRWRRKRHYSQEALAERAEVHRTEISLLECADRVPGLDVILKLSGALDVRPEALLKGATFVPPDDGKPGRYVYEEIEIDA